MAWQGTINSFLARQLSLAHATLIVHIIGAIFALMIVIGGTMIGQFGAKLSQLPEIPWYAYLGGIMGVGIVWGVAASIGEAGAAPATTAIVAAQVTTAAALDHFGFLHLQEVPFSAERIIGLLLLAAGTWLILQQG